MSAALARREPLLDPPPGTLDDARRLATLIRECRLADIGRKVLHLRLSALPEGRTRPHHLQLAREALLPLTGAARAQLFELPNQDLVVAWRGESSALRTSLDALELLFSDDPAFGPDPMGLAGVLDLPADGDYLLEVVENSLRPRQPPAAPRGPGLPLDLPALFALERAITQADMSRFARREPVMRVLADGTRLAWEHRFLSDSELFDTILPERSPRAEPFLFRRLTRALDRRMLALLAAPDELRGVAPFSVDLNVASLIGPEFLRFDTNLPTGLRGRVTLNLRGEDILGDLPTFRFARDFVAARNYRLLLADASPALLALLPPDRLGIDLVQLPFTPTLAAGPLMPGIDPAQVVLSAADQPAAMAWGKAQGIALFQGLRR